MKNISILTLLLFAITSYYSCNKNKQNDKEVNYQAIEKTLDTTLNYDLSKYDPPFDIFELKKKYEEGSTSTLLNNENITLYDKSNGKGYFGKYTFSDYYKDDVYRIGYLTVFNDKNPWLYNNEEDKFIEIVVNYPGISIFDEIEVGANISFLNKYLGTPCVEGESLIAYKNEKSSFIALFVIKDEIIESYLFGYYKDEIIKNVEKYIPLLLKKCLFAGNKNNSAINNLAAELTRY